MIQADIRSQAWTRYWASGALHSCDGSFALQGEGAIAAFWRAVFANAPAQGHLLDLGTGNGGLMLAASRALQGWRLTGVDLSRPTLPWLDAGRDRGRIQLFAETRMEQVPLPSGAINLLVSQFGIEYADHQQVVREALRLLAPGGRLALVVHHAESVVTRVADDELRALDLLAADDGLLAATTVVLPHMAALRGGEAPSPAAYAARESFNRAMHEVSALMATLEVADVLGQAQAGVQGMLLAVHPGNLHEALGKLAAYRDELAAAAVRAREQIQAAMTRGQLDAFLMGFREAMPALEASPLLQDGRLIAWAVRGMRAD